MKRMTAVVAAMMLMTGFAGGVSAEDNSKKRIGFMYDSVIPHFAVGGPQWQTTFIFHNPSNSLEKFYLTFTDDAGKPMLIPVLGGMHSSILVTLPAHNTQKIVSDYRPDLPTMSGSARLTDPYSCSDCNYFYTTVHTIFAQYDWEKKVFLCEATVPQESPWETDVALVYDQEIYVMGVALMNPSEYQISLVNVSVYDQNDNLLQLDQFYMNPLAHKVFSLSDKYPVTIGKLGYVRFSVGTGGVAGTALRFAPNGTFTTMHFVTVY